MVAFSARRDNARKNKACHHENGGNGSIGMRRYRIMASRIVASARIKI